MFRRKILFQAFKLLDLLMMMLAFLLAAYVSYRQVGELSFIEFLDMRIKIQNFALFLGLILTWHIIFSLFELYQSKRLSGRWEEVKDILKASTLGTLLIMLAAVIFRIDLTNAAFFGAFWMAGTGITILSRLALRYALARIRIRGRNIRYMLIVGTNLRALQFAQKIESKPELGYRLLGFADDDWSGIGELEKNGYKRVTDFNGLLNFLRQNVVDEVMVSLPMKSFYEKASRIVTQCETQGINIRFLSNIFNMKHGHQLAEQFADDSVLNISTGAIKGFPAIFKRILDILVSTILLIALSPLFLMATLMIKLISPGPILFHQDRVGLNKRRFRLYKFRTMIQGAEAKMAEVESLNEVTGPVFKIKNDPRITKIGKFLRSTSIDELPQLINVLKGDMSLVGPRPLPVRDYNGFDEDWHRRRFSVRPGITCLWQINGRSDISFDKWMQLDMDYIDNWSLFLDLKILLRTIPAVLKGSGAV